MALEFDDQGYDWSTADLGPYERLIGGRLLGYRPSWDYSPIQTGDVYRLESGELEQGPPELPEYVVLVGAIGLGPGSTIDGQWVDDFAEYRAQRNGFDVAIVNAHDVYTHYNQGEDFLTAELIRAGRDPLEAAVETVQRVRDSYELRDDHQAVVLVR